MRAQVVAVDAEQALLVAMVGEEERRGQQVETVGAGPGIRLLGPHRGDPDGRARALQRFRSERVAFDRRPASVIRDVVLAPQRPDDGEVFVEALAAFAHRHVGDVIVVFVEPAPDTEIQPAVRQHVGHRVILRGAHRIVQRQQADRAAEADATRLARAGGDEHGRRAERKTGHAMFGKPRAVEAEPFGQLHLLDHPFVPVLPGAGQFLVIIGNVAEPELHDLSSTGCGSGACPSVARLRNAAAVLD